MPGKKIRTYNAHGKRSILNNSCIECRRTLIVFLANLDYHLIDNKSKYLETNNRIQPQVFLSVYNLLKLPARDVRHSHVPDFAATYKVIQSTVGFFQGGGVIETVGLVAVVGEGVEGENRDY